MVTIGSLFSGIGGFELGLEWAGLGPVAWQVEKDPFCRAVLAKHWPEVERFDDVCTVGRTTLHPVDLICGGFPCQDVSSAGGRAGLDGPRSGLWYEFARIASELRPEWLVIENVASGANQWVDPVRGRLAELDYASLPVPVAASDCGAPHRRGRIFIVAHTACLASGGAARSAWTATPGNAADPHRNGQPARAFDAEVAGTSAASNALRARCKGADRSADEGRAEPPPRAWRSPVPDVLRMVHGVSARMDRARARVSALGNAVVPQCAEVVGWVIRELMRERDEMQRSWRYR